MIRVFPILCPLSLLPSAFCLGHGPGRGGSVAQWLLWPWSSLSAFTGHTAVIWVKGGVRDSAWHRTGALVLTV